ncbi:hypothetical protein EDD99_4478 [Streptomyces sp. 846.5]|nr:hypothetical protein [Streptomyces sp. 846.5]TDU05937.1 hypothetical protein EDD99_4478 [Streptomyces sp. 846.5]
MFPTRRTPGAGRRRGKAAAAPVASGGSSALLTAYAAWTEDGAPVRGFTTSSWQPVR